MTFILFRVTCTLLHVLVSAVLYIEYAYIYVRRKLDRLYKKYVEVDRELVSRHVKLCDKIPSHLVVIIGNESIFYRDLAKIVVWSIAAGISFLSFYDHQGILKKNEAELFRAISEVTKGHVENIIWGKKTKSHEVINNEIKNGVTSARKLHLNLFSLSDGKQGLVELTKNLCQSAVSGHMRAADINQDVIDEHLQAQLDIPDPELALICGDVCSTYGFLPWQIRVTELLQLESHHDIQVQEFLLMLERYGKCVQRFGK